MMTARALPERGLIIREPHLCELLSDRKIWEMRTQRVRLRGRIGLIRKGSGLVVGTAELVDCLPALDAAGLAASVQFHGAPIDRHANALANGWIVPWVLQNVETLDPPVRYRHPPGAIIWVTLGMSHDEHSKPQSSALETDIVTLTASNIQNSHINLRALPGFFPAETVGGPNAQSAAQQKMTIIFKPGAAIELDKGILGAPYHCSSAFDELVSSHGLHDLWRRSNGAEARDWTWLSNRHNGFRIDHAFGNDAFIQKHDPVCRYDHTTREERHTDHSAIVLTSPLWSSKQDPPGP